MCLCDHPTDPARCCRDINVSGWCLCPCHRSGGANEVKGADVSTDDRIAALERRVTEHSTRLLALEAAPSPDPTPRHEEGASEAGGVYERAAAPLCGKHGTRVVMTKGGFISWDGVRYQRWFCGTCGAIAEIVEVRESLQLEQEIARLRADLGLSNDQINAIDEATKAGDSVGCATSDPIWTSTLQRVRDLKAELASERARTAAYAATIATVKAERDNARQAQEGMRAELAEAQKAVEVQKREVERQKFYQQECVEQMGKPYWEVCKLLDIDGTDGIVFAVEELKERAAHPHAECEACHPKAVKP